jgi:hypothetical protein
MELKNDVLYLTRNEVFSVLDNNTEKTDQNEIIKTKLHNMIYHFGNRMTDKQRSWLISKMEFIFLHNEIYKDYYNKVITDIVLTDVKGRK